MFKRIVIFIIAIFLCGLGIAVSTQADLGTTPISSLPYILTFMTPFSFGITTIMINVVFLFVQLLILKKEFKKVYYLQLVVTLFFGTFIDLGMHLAEPFKTTNYLCQIIMLIVGSAILALGVLLEVFANLLYVPGEGVVKAISAKTGKEFGKMKVVFDWSLCLMAIILSLVVLGKIQGLREGTLLSAFLVGGFICLYRKLWQAISFRVKF